MVCAARAGVLLGFFWRLLSAADPLLDKAHYFQKDLIDKHLLEGLYVSIVPAHGKPAHTVDEPGNVIHAGVWTGRYLAGVGYQYAVTSDPWVRRHGAELLRGLRQLREVTGKPGLLARGYVKGHGPVAGWERGGNDSKEWHQGQGRYSDYRWYGDVSVDNFNAVLYGYAIYYDLAADAVQKKIIAEDVGRLMTHLLDNHCRIVDVDGEVTLYGHVGVDPDPARDDYYKKTYRLPLVRFQVEEPAKLPLRASLFLLPDLLIAHRVTGQTRYLDLYHQVVDRYRHNPDKPRSAAVNHSSEGQAYEALYNLVRYERDPELGKLYRPWARDLWDKNWMEGNALFAWMTRAMLGEETAHWEEARRLAIDTLERFPRDRVFRPVMNSLRKDLDRSKPLPINQRPLDNEYEWKGDPYRLDGWLKPTITAFQTACDDPQAAWFADTTGRVYLSLDGWRTWRDVSAGLMGAQVRNLAASAQRTFVLWADTDQGLRITRDGGMSWRPAPPTEAPLFAGREELAGRVKSFAGWRIPVVRAVFSTARGLVASGPGGAYLSQDAENWTELKLWPEYETGAADYLHAYWMGRYYKLVK